MCSGFDLINLMNLAIEIDKKIEEYRQEQKHMEYIIDLKRHVAMDAKEYFKEIQEYI